LATSEQRDRPRKVGTSKAVKAAPRKTSAAAKKAAPTKTASGPRSVKPAAAKAVSKPRTRTKPKAVDPAEQLRGIVLDALDNLKARDVAAIDVRGKSSIADLMVVASGTSSRHVKSLADEVVKKAKLAGVPPIGVEGQREAEWVLVDLGDVIVHVMLPRTREFYGLERLWTVGDRELATAV
jgi:ribosome silencing factor RsfS/YbeB/iojap